MVRSIRIFSVSSFPFLRISSKIRSFRMVLTHVFWGPFLSHIYTRTMSFRFTRMYGSGCDGNDEIGVSDESNIYSTDGFEDIPVTPLLRPP